MIFVKLNASYTLYISMLNIYVRLCFSSVLDQINGLTSFDSSKALHTVSCVMLSGRGVASILGSKLVELSYCQMRSYL